MKICVFCGSSTGNHPIYKDYAQKLGHCFAKENIDLVYGGGNVGLMGIIADSVLKNGGKVYGVIPEFLKGKELAHLEVTKLYTVDSMHTRKAKMADLSDGFITLPGGLGTFEELFEIWTWGQLGLHSKPCGLVNVNGYYDALLQQIQHMVNEGFIKQDYLDMLITSDNCEEIIQQFTDYTPPTEKWDSEKI